VTLEEQTDRPEFLASLIDHTLLKPEATRADIVRVCLQARDFRFHSVCVNPFWVPVAVAELAGSGVKVCTTIGFPLGAHATAAKIAEADLALVQGANELDMVQNIGALRSGDLQLVRKEIAEIATLAHARNALLKVILETCLLSDEEKRTACLLAKEAGADFVKTSTGFSTGGARREDIQLMRQIVGDSLGVKASGGIRTLQALKDMVAAGANRIGTSSGPAILAEAFQARAFAKPAGPDTQY
jgi:deoxyribose-phosphate aldolase